MAETCPSCGRESLAVVAGYDIAVLDVQDQSVVCKVSENVEGRAVHVHAVDSRRPNPNDAKERPAYQDPEWLREQYHDRDFSGREIADACDVGQTTVYTWMEKFGIARDE